MVRPDDTDIDELSVFNIDEESRLARVDEDREIHDHLVLENMHLQERLEDALDHLSQSKSGNHNEEIERLHEMIAQLQRGQLEQAEQLQIYKVARLAAELESAKIREMVKFQDTQLKNSVKVQEIRLKNAREFQEDKLKDLLVLYEADYQVALELQVGKLRDDLQLQVGKLKDDLQLQVGKLKEEGELHVSKAKNELEVSVTEFKGELEKQIAKLKEELKLQSDLIVDMKGLKSIYMGKFCDVFTKLQRALDQLAEIKDENVARDEQISSLLGSTKFHSDEIGRMQGVEEENNSKLAALQTAILEATAQLAEHYTEMTSTFAQHQGFLTNVEGNTNSTGPGSATFHREANVCTTPYRLHSRNVTNSITVCEVLPPPAHPRDPRSHLRPRQGLAHLRYQARQQHQPDAFCALPLLGRFALH